MNVKLKALKNEKGFINLAIYSEKLGTIRIKLDDFNGKDKVKCKKLTYKIYCLTKEEY